MGRPEDSRGTVRGFHRSFFVRMVVSFLALTLAVAAIEIGIRLAVVLYDFGRAADETQVAAERLSEDVRSIMLNSGGPVASRTVYPILQRNFRRAGLEIAIEPSAVTISSIRKRFGFEAEGLRPSWPPGRYQEGRAELRAEAFCLGCHTDAAVGGVLGTVRVRDYLPARLAGGWAEARLTGTLNFLKAVLHTVILFFLLRTLLGPLLALRGAVAQLAKGGAGLSTRAEVRSADEFGELASDLNAFLDRADHILTDLHGTIAKTVAVSTRLAQITTRTTEQLDRVQRALGSALPPLEAGEELAAPRLAAQLEALELVAAAIEQQAGGAGGGVATGLQRRVAAARAEWERHERFLAGLPRLVHEVHEFRHTVEQVRFLEEHLKDVAEDGERLLERLVGHAP